jgi:hypothetical protein
MKSHLLNMLLYAFIVSAFFSTLFRPDLRSRLRLGVILFLALVGSVLVLAYLMYPFPR